MKPHNDLECVYVINPIHRHLYFLSNQISEIFCKNSCYFDNHASAALLLVWYSKAPKNHYTATLLSKLGVAPHVPNRTFFDHAKTIGGQQRNRFCAVSKIDDASSITHDVKFWVAENSKSAKNLKPFSFWSSQRRKEKGFKVANEFKAEMIKYYPQCC